jgi:DNA-binding transcriptional MocR family regulator
VPGDYSFQADENGQVPRNHLRLSFGQVAPDQIGPGIERFARAVAARLDQPGRVPNVPLNLPA